jgi:thiol-disulfide isomerase/thioredoxin
MKARKFTVMILLSLVVFPLLTSFVSIYGINESPPTTTMEFKSELIHEGAPAIDWELKELVTDTNYTFSSDFAGKVVMIDFFATWCGPCIAAMPLLGQVNDHFSGESDFVLLSISLDDPGFSESALETFISNNNMDWLVFYDEYRDVAPYYLIEAIPTLLIFSKTHYIYFAEEGIGSATPLIDAAQEMLDMNDNSDPVINDITSPLSLLSVLSNELELTADITEDYIRHVEFNLTIGDYQETLDFWAPDTSVIEYTFDIDPQIIYNATSDGYTNATVDVFVEDYVNRDSSDTFTINLENLADVSIPEVTLDDIIETDGVSTQTVKIETTITDDLLVVAHDVELWLDGVLEDSKELEEGSLADSYDATFYGLAVKKKQELVIRVIAEDVAGNIVVEEYLYNFTGGAGITLPIVFGIVILSNLLLIPLIRRRNKNQT